MNLDKAQLLLDKINRLYKSMSLDPENVAQIEKDLMKDYVKLLYGTFLEEGVPTQRTTYTKNIERTIEPPKPIVRQRDVHQPTATPKRTERVVSPPPVERMITPPPVEQVIAPPPPVREEVIAETPPPVYQPTVAASRNKHTTPDLGEYDTLFQQEESNELSHKLSSLPISDLHKAMGINERIFTINELFRGDSQAFKHTMTSLNQLNSFEEAKSYLAQNIAGEFDWTNKSRRNKAKNFIRLVKRRYI